MSRLKKFTHSLLSGYVLLGVTVFYTLASVPLALHYLSKTEFGLWALVMQVSQYLQLVDLGMSASIGRILIDHKDRPADGVYGAVIKTGALVLVVQGAIITVAGTALSFCLPALFSIPPELRRDFTVLVAGQCVVLGVLFVARMPRFMLEAHQRNDASNYSQIGMLVINIGVMWWGFAKGWGLYSLLAGYAASQVFGAGSILAAAAWLQLFPPTGAWGYTNRKTFHELFSFGREIFLLTVGLQLISASQLMVISRTLGLEAAAVWSIATKPFIMAQQVVNKLLDFATPVFAEMMVRQEKERLLARFRDLVVLTASLAVWVGLAVGLCSQDFLALWTKGRITWSNSSTWLMAFLVMVYATIRCGIGFIFITKQIRALKYIYLFEGFAFVALSLLTAPIWGINGIIVSALMTDLFCSGTYGLWRTKEYFQLDSVGIVLGWLRRPLVYLLALALAFGLLGSAGGDWNPNLRLSVHVVAAFVIGLALFWQLGLSPHLRAESRVLAGKIRLRLRPLPNQVAEPKTKV